MRACLSWLIYLRMQDCLVPFSIQVIFVAVDGLHHHVRLCQGDKVSSQQEPNEELDEFCV